MTLRTRAGVIAVALAQVLLAACGNEGRLPASVTAPSPSPPGPVGAANPGRLVNGSVYDSARRPLAGALVTVLEGSRAGTSSTADANGAFSFPERFGDSTTFRASSEGHIAAVAIIDIRGTARPMDFYLRPTVPPVDMAGEYTLTLTADSACAALPDEARTRTYQARVTPNGAVPTSYFDVWLSGATFFDGFDRSERFAILVAGRDVEFWVGDRQTQPAFVEELTARTYVAIGGGASATVGGSPSSIVASFDGVIEYCAMPPDTTMPVDAHGYNCPQETSLARVRCESHAHRLTLTRQ
jgi:hypothetical protein